MTFDIFYEFVKNNMPTINVENEQFMISLYEKYSAINKKLYKYLISKMFIRRSNMSYLFWVDRGWSENDAKKRISLKQSNVSNIVKKRRKESEEYNDNYMKTIDRIKQSQIEKGTYERISKSKGNGNKWEFYIDKMNPITGTFYTETEARNKIRLKQRKFFDRMWKSIKDEEGIFFYNSSVDYYLNKGFTLQEAEAELSKRQSTFSLDLCIQKYGKELGVQKFKDRQNKWQATLNNKTDEEKLEIYKKKLRNFKHYSKSSILLFNKVYLRLQEDGINLTFYMKDKEKFIWDIDNRKIYFYDLYIKELKMIVEYQGILFHPKPHLSQDELLSWKCPISKRNGIEVSAKDIRKKVLAESLGYIFMTIWEDDKDAEQILYDTIKHKYKISKL